MDVTEKWGDDVDSAVELALADLKLTRDQVDVEVLERPSRGFFGIGSKLALVRVSRKEVQEEVQETPATPVTPDVSETEEEFVIEKSVEVEETEVVDSKDEPENTEEDPVTEIKEPVEDGEDMDCCDKTFGQSEKYKNQKSFTRKKEYSEEFEEKKNFEEIPLCDDHQAVIFLKDVISKMGLKLDTECRSEDGFVFINISGQDARTIIGKRGQTLDAIQYLVSLVVNKNSDEYIKVVIDAENYRSRRKKTLQQLAERLASKAVRTGRSVRLEPMNPYERKVIHAALQQNPDVVTRSEGQDPYRRVVIEQK